MLDYLYKNDCCNIDIKVNDGMWGLSGAGAINPPLDRLRMTVYDLKLPYIKYLTTNQTNTLAEVTNQLFMAAVVCKSNVPWF